MLKERACVRVHPVTFYLVLKTQMAVLRMFVFPSYWQNCMYIDATWLLHCVYSFLLQREQNPPLFTLTHRFQAVLWWDIHSCMLLCFPHPVSLPRTLQQHKEIQVTELRPHPESSTSPTSAHVSQGEAQGSWAEGR